MFFRSIRRAAGGLLVPPVFLAAEHDDHNQQDDDEESHANDKTCRQRNRFTKVFISNSLINSSSPINISILMNSSFSFFRSLVVSWEDVSGPILAAVVIDIAVVVVVMLVLGVRAEVSTGATVVVKTHSGLCEAPISLK